MLKGKLFIELLCFFGRAKKKLAGTLVFLFALEFFHGIEMLKGEIFSFCFFGLFFPVCFVSCMGPRTFKGRRFYVLLCTFLRLGGNEKMN